MSFMSYLFSRLQVVLISVFFLFFLSFSLIITGFSPSLVILIDVSFLFFVFVFLLVSYLSWRRKIEKMEKTISSLDEKYLIGEVLDVPNDPVAYQYYLLMKEISSSAIMKIEKEEEARKNYCNYLDNWVHEIKTPLASLSLILDNGGDKGKMKREIKRAENITDTILSLSRLDNIEKDKNITLLSLRSLVDEAIRDQMSLLIPQGIRVEIQGEGKALTDHILFSSILRQILVNTAKYAPASTLSFEISQGELIVEDNGPGIPSYEIKRVTEKGYVGERWKGKNGSGMGLYIVKELSKELSIDFSIESEEGRYTRFNFRFPSFI